MKVGPLPWISSIAAELQADGKIDGAGRVVDGYINLDLFATPGVDIVADAEQLPFPAGVFQRVECDAVLEHTRAPFCHPFHEYPKD